MFALPLEASQLIHLSLLGFISTEGDVMWNLSNAMGLSSRPPGVLWLHWVTIFLRGRNHSPSPPSLELSTTNNALKDYHKLSLQPIITNYFQFLLFSSPIAGFIHLPMAAPSPVLIRSEHSHFILHHNDLHQVEIH